MSSLFLEVSKRSLAEGAREDMSTAQGWSDLALRTAVWLGEAAPHESSNDSRPQCP